MLSSFQKCSNMILATNLLGKYSVYLDSSYTKDESTENFVTILDHTASSTKWMSATQSS